VLTIRKELILIHGVKEAKGTKVAHLIVLANHSPIIIVEDIIVVETHLINLAVHLANQATNVPAVHSEKRVIASAIILIVHAKILVKEIQTVRVVISETTETVSKEQDAIEIHLIVPAAVTEKERITHVAVLTETILIDQNVLSETLKVVIVHVVLLVKEEIVSDLPAAKVVSIAQSVLLEKEIQIVHAAVSEKVRIVHAAVSVKVATVLEIQDVKAIALTVHVKIQETSTAKDLVALTEIIQVISPGHISADRHYQDRKGQMAVHVVLESNVKLISIMALLMAVASSLHWIQMFRSV